MDNTPTTRPWDPTAPSLLWAHEIRRENIHLLNQLSTTQSDLSKTAHALSTLQQTVSSLETAVQNLRARENNNTQAEAEAEAETREALGRRITGLEENINARLEEFGKVLEGIGGENKRLEGLVNGVRGEWEKGVESAVGVQLGVVKADVRDMMRVEVSRVVREVMCREMEGLQCCSCCGKGMFTISWLGLGIRY